MVEEKLNFKEEWSEGLLFRSERHRKKVEDVVKQVRNCPEGKLLTVDVTKQFEVHSPLSKKYKKGRAHVDLSQLNEILRIDDDFVTLESSCCLGPICKELLNVGKMLCVVATFEWSTIGGVIAGLGLESDSFKFGLTGDQAVAFEMVLPSGEVVVASEDNQYSDLFSQIQGSFGTLGFLTAVKLKIKKVSAHPYVRIKYRYFEDNESFLKAFRELHASKERLEKFDYLEGMFPDPSTKVLTEVCFAEDVKSDKFVTFQPLSNGFSKWFYQRALERPAEDIMSTYEYVFRHQPSVYWYVPEVLQHHYKVPHFMFDVSLFRYLVSTRPRILQAQKLVKTAYNWMRKLPLFGRLLEVAAGFQTVQNFLWNESGEYIDRMIVQDTGFEMESLEKGCQFWQSLENPMPLWFCACKVPFYDCLQKRGGWKDTICSVDIGFWGYPGERPSALEKACELQLLSDRPAGFGRIFISEEEFNKKFDLSKYDAVYNKYGNGKLEHLKVKLLKKK